MKVAATIFFGIVLFLFVDFAVTDADIHPIRSDFLELDREPAAEESPIVEPEAETRTLDQWMDTLRRLRTRRQSRFS